MNLAPRGTRFLAQFVDGVIAFVPIVIVAVVMPTEVLDSDAGAVYILVSLVFGIGYYLFADAMPRGQSVGKVMLGIAVVDQSTHAPCTVLQSFARNVLQPILGALDWIFILGRRRQRLGDMLARTIVVEQGRYSTPERAYAEFDRA